MDPIFRETRVGVEPSSSWQVVNISVPSPGRSLRSQQQLQQAATARGLGAVSADEAAFRRHNLASAAAVYYRTAKQQQYHGPRSFLWRVLEEGAVVSIRAVDVHRGGEERGDDEMGDEGREEGNAGDDDFPLTLNLHFESPVYPTCVALADSPDHDAVYVHALDQSLRLHSFTLRPDFFRHRLEGGLPPDAHRTYQPSEISSHLPHRLYAVSPELLVVALYDGSLVKLERVSGKTWTEVSLNSSGWGAGIRSLFFTNKSSIKHGKHSLDHSTTTSAEATTLGVEGQLFLVTVCLDHRMRIWNLRTNALVHTGDILDQPRNPQDVAKYTLDPAQTTLVRIVGEAEGNRLCVTYSPLGAGEFKFWSITMRDLSTVVVEDRFPGMMNLVPVNPSSSDLWTLADYAILHPRHNDVQVWALWKNNMTYRVQHLDARLDSLEDHWHSRWGMVQPSTNTLSTTPPSGPCEPTDTTEKWLQTILAPGRFTRATIETALGLYERSLGSSSQDSAPSTVSSSRGRSRSVAEAICTVISASTTLQRRSFNGEADFDEYRNANEKHWRQFLRLLVELDKQRGEALTLAFDAVQAMPWVVCVDGLAAVRACSELERMSTSSTSSSSSSRDPSRVLVGAGLAFADALSDNMWQLCNSLLRGGGELFTDKTDLARIQAFYDASGLWKALDPEDCQQVVETLGVNYKLASPAAYSELLERIGPSERTRRHRHSFDSQASKRRRLTEFGLRLVARTTHETVNLQWRVCFSQLLLLVHMEYELENEEDALHNSVDVCFLFSRLVAALRRLELIRWLGTAELSSSSVLSKKSGAEIPTTALAEAITPFFTFGDLSWNEPLTRAITAAVRDLCATQGPEIMPTHVQAVLLNKGRPDLARELAPFCGEEPAAVYLQATVALELGEWEGAAALFRRAATGMSTKKDDLNNHLTPLIDDTDRPLLHAGPASYYRHITSLFERAGAYSHVIDFAGLALQFHSLDPPEKTQDSESPTTTTSIKTEILSRIFNASLKTCRYEVAHTSLQSMTDARLQSSCLGLLVDGMCASGHGADMMALPFGRLQSAVDELLEQRCVSHTDTQYHQILYAWRVRYHNYRGAAAVLHQRIERLRDAGDADYVDGSDGFDTPITKLYLLLINALSCVQNPAERWIISGGDLGAEYARASEAAAREMSRAIAAGAQLELKLEPGEDGRKKKRRVVTLDEARREYQAELDRISAIQNNLFGFDAGDAMDLGV